MLQMVFSQTFGFVSRGSKVLLYAVIAGRLHIGCARSLYTEKGDAYIYV